MNARSIALPDRVDLRLGQVIDRLLQRESCAGGRVQLRHMMRLVSGKGIAGQGLRKLTRQFKHRLDADRVVRSKEQSYSLAVRKVLHRRKSVVPSRRSHHYLGRGCEARAQVSKYGLRCGEVDHDIEGSDERRCQSRCTGVFLCVEDMYAMAPLRGHLGHKLAGFSVT